MNHAPRHLLSYTKSHSLNHPRGRNPRPPSRDWSTNGIISQIPHTRMRCARTCFQPWLDALSVSTTENTVGKASPGELWDAEKREYGFPLHDLALIAFSTFASYVGRSAGCYVVIGINRASSVHLCSLTERQNDTSTCVSDVDDALRSPCIRTFVQP